MPTNDFTPQFHRAMKSFIRRNDHRRKSVKSALATFADNPHHPGLHLEKLRGSDVWTIRIDSGNRLFFVWSNTGDTAIFFFIGSHDAYRTKG